MMNNDLWFMSINICSFLALGKGFPPGCQDIKLPSAPTTECSQTLQVKFNHFRLI